MEKEKTIVISVLVVLVIVLIYTITLINRPGGDFVKNLTEPPKNGQTNNQTQNMTITPQPGDEKLVKKDVVLGNGDEAKVGDTVSVNYVGTLENGTKFDSSYDRKQPFSFTIGKGEVIRGWDLGLQGMKVGGKRELIIPSDLAYGDTGQGSIPPKATLKFSIELLGIKNVGQEKINVSL